MTQLISGAWFSGATGVRANRFMILLCAFLGFGATARPAASSFPYTDFTRPDFFPILPWDPYHGWKSSINERRTNGLESIAACNFNMAGFVLPKDLRQCEKLGLGAILLPSDSAFTNFNYFRAWKQLSDDAIEKRIKQIIRAGGSSRAITGYFITDEPGVGDFPALAKAVGAVKKQAPGKLAYINLYPDYATLGAPDRSQLGTSNYTEYLERFVTEVEPQALSYDNYMVQYSGDVKDPAKAASYYRNMLEIRRVAHKYGIPCLNIVCANQIRPNTQVPSPANLALQAYTTLAAGFRGVTWYNYYGPGYHYTAIDSSGAKTLTWIYLRDINSQVAALAPTMSRLNSTGVFFTSPAPAENLPLLPGRLVESVSCVNPLMIGEFRHGEGEDYVMVVNLSLERSAKFLLTPKQAVRPIDLVSAVTGSSAPLKANEETWLVAGQGVLLRFER